MTVAPTRPARAAAQSAAPGPGSLPASADRALPRDPCLERLAGAIEAARALGIDVSGAEAVRDDAAARLGFPTDRAVVALVGGTGVGKSSLLNAIAGSEVSAASVRRPTTATAVAWVPETAAEALAPVLDWLDVAPGDRRTHADDTAVGSAILDLPDLDSIEPDHRRRVDEVLPRADAVIWVTDPEKYHDAVLHDEVLARWLPRLGRQLVVVNKADRLSRDDAERLRRDLERDVRRLAATGPAGSRPPTVVLASTLSRGAVQGGSQAAPGIEAVRAWLDETATAKAVVRARLVASIRAAIATLARAAGVDGRSAPGLLPRSGRDAATDRAVAALLRVVDLDALERQAIAATRAGARSRGAGPLGGLTSRLFRWSGREARVADPAAFLVRWRDRGTAASASAAIREALAEPLRTAPPAIRRSLSGVAGAGAVEDGLARAVDRAIGGDPGQPPSSRWWTVLGLAQTITTALLVLTAIWVGLWILVRFPVDSVALPVVGRVPTPFVAIVVVLALGYLLARLLGAHAGHVGRRWASALGRRIRDAVAAEVTATAFADVDRIEDQRGRLAAILVEADRDCA